MSPPRAENLEHVYLKKEQKSLERVLEFTGHTIHDVINDSIARERVKHYFRVYWEVERQMKEAERLKQAKEGKHPNATNLHPQSTTR